MYNDQFHIGYCDAVKYERLYPIGQLKARFWLQSRIVFTLVTGTLAFHP